MSVTNTSYKDSYAGRGDTGPYAITFDVVLDDGGNATDVVVKLIDPAGTESDITSVCTVTGMNVYTTASYGATYTVVLIRYPALTQPYAFPYGTKFPSRTFERALDRLLFAVQRLSLESDQSLKVPLSEAEPARLPTVADRANQLLGFDADGDPIPASGSAAPVTPFMATVLDDVSAAAARETLETDYTEEISGSQTMAARRNYHITAEATLTLPSSPLIGDTICLRCLGAGARIVQDSSDHVISWRGGLFTTKGTAGYLQLRHGDIAFLTYCGSGLSENTPTKITDPATLPTGNGYGVAWSPSGRYLAITHATSPFITIYDWYTGSPIKIADPATLPTVGASYPCWSPDDRYLAVPISASPWILIYDFSSGSPVKISDPATLPGAAAYATAWSPDGKFLAVGHSVSATRKLLVYDWATGSPVSIADAATQPFGTPTGAEWSPNGRYLAVSHVGSPYCSTYDFFTGAPVKIADPSTLPGGQADNVCWSPDGRFMNLAIETSPYTVSYDWASGLPVKMSEPAAAPAGVSRSVRWSPSGRALSFALAASPYVTIYKRTPASLVKITDPVSLPAGNGIGVAWSPSGRYLAIAHTTTPFLTIYDCRTTALKEWAVQIQTKGGILAGDRNELEYRFK